MKVLDEQAAGLLALGAQHPSPALETLSIKAARAQVDAGLPALALPSEAVSSIVNLVVPAASGEPALPIRLYRPSDSRPDEPLPAVVFFHGGGWVCCGIESHDSLCRYLANRSGAAFVSVEYRLAPEHRFPAAVEDSLRALNWVAAGALIGVDAARLALAGDSAGGNLAAVIAQLSAGRVALRHQLLMYPVLDSSRRWPSAELYGRGCFLDVSTMDWFVQLYERSPADRLDPRFSPLLTPQLNGVAPATMLVAGHDMNRDEALAYRDRLEQFSVPVVTHLHERLPHGFASMAGYIAAARAALDQGAAALRSALS